MTDAGLPLLSEARVMEIVRGTGAEDGTLWHDVIEDAIRQAVKEAVEAAAKVCDDCECDDNGFGMAGGNAQKCAAAIRSRLQKA